MTKITFIAFNLLISVVGFSQINITNNGVAQGSTLDYDTTTATLDHFYKKLYLVNNGATSVDVHFKRRKNYAPFPWTDQICDMWQCFDAEGLMWERPISPSVPILTLAPGATSVFELKVYPEGTDGCGIYTYYIEDENKVLQDSVQVTFTQNGGNCFLGSDFEDELDDFKVYPNPVNGILNIESYSGENTTFVLYNGIGQEVMSAFIGLGINSINISAFDEGIYYYAILEENQVLLTEKLIIKK